MLVLTVTRRCNLRCTYCPVARSDETLDAGQAVRAIDLFVRLCGGGDVKLFGGEPLLAPRAVHAALDAAAARPAIRRVFLSTNGLALDGSWLDRVERTPNLVLLLSLDGRPPDHDSHRRTPAGEGSFATATRHLPRLVSMPRVVVTVTVPPEAAGRVAESVAHLIELGFWRFNILPGYLLEWSDAQLAQLREGFDRLAALVERRWMTGSRFYLRNLFVREPTPLLNTGLVVDSDGGLHASNLALVRGLEHVRQLTRIGSLDDPPAAEALQAAAARMPSVLAASLPEATWRSTLAADAELTRMCRRLARAFTARRRSEAA